MLASAAYGVGGVMVRSVLRRWDPVAMSAVQISFLALYSGVLLAATGPVELDLSADVWLSLAALGALGTGVAYVAYFTLIREAGAVRASLVAYVIPVVGVILGAAVLDEPVAWNTLAGGLVIIAGVGLGTGGLRLVFNALRPRLGATLPRGGDG